MTDPHVAKNFRRSEFACKCCGKVIIQPDLPKALQELRDLMGSPIVITSGFRCKAKNDSLPGASKYSTHLGGFAADCFFPGVDLMSAYLSVVMIWPWSDSGGIGLYPKWIDKEGKVRGNFIHLDVRKKRSRWGQIRGKNVSFEEALLETQTGGDNEQVL